MAAFGIAVVAVLLVAPRGLGVLGDWLLAPWLPQPGPGRQPGGMLSLAKSKTKQWRPLRAIGRPHSAAPPRRAPRRRC